MDKHSASGIGSFDVQWDVTRDVSQLTSLW
ncbi:hypothetical protein FHW67_003526 [Herbaspirillum sp. Sphag1AN]|nr:hypothetical protein [Herbaspirillum sp. Sphag1AN]MBB3247234.1 hypothetical protein [Herbaspirillum sp. Sphag64]